MTQQSTQGFLDGIDPETLRRARDVVQDLRSQGWNARISTFPSSGARTAAQQAAHRQAGRSGVAVSVHQNLNATGRPASLAVHIFDPDVGTNVSSSHPFARALEDAASRHGGITGRGWSNPDPLHFQSVALRDQAASLRTHRPRHIPFFRGVPAAPPAPRLMVPTLATSSTPAHRPFYGHRAETAALPALRRLLRRL